MVNSGKCHSEPEENLIMNNKNDIMNKLIIVKKSRIKWQSR